MDSSTTMGLDVGDTNTSLQSNDDSFNATDVAALSLESASDRHAVYDRQKALLRLKADILTDGSTDEGFGSTSDGSSMNGDYNDHNSTDHEGYNDESFSVGTAFFSRCETFWKGNKAWHARWQRWGGMMKWMMKLFFGKHRLVILAKKRKTVIMGVSLNGYLSFEVNTRMMSRVLMSPVSAVVKVFILSPKESTMADAAPVAFDARVSIEDPASVASPTRCQQIGQFKSLVLAGSALNSSKCIQEHY
jgi:hypothetical protein